MIGYDWYYDNSSTRPIRERFQITWKPISRERMPWRDEIYAIARSIAETEKRPLVVCMSGGIDSEVVARSFYDQGIPFSALSAEYKDGTNEHDIGYARRFCAERGIVHHILPLDPSYHFDQGIKRWMDAGYEAYSIFRYLQLYLIEYAESRGWCSISGGGCQTYTTVENDICIKQNSGMVCVLQWMQRNSSLHHPVFFSNTPEAAAAWQEIDLVATMLRNPDYFKTNMKSANSLEKKLILHSLWLDMEPRDKYDGFERLSNLANRKSRELSKIYPHISRRFFPVTQMRAQLGLPPL